MNNKNTKKLNIAIFGSNSHIAKSLINNFLKDTGFSLHLYTRSLDKSRSFLKSIGRVVSEDCVIHGSYKDFLRPSYDVIINCVGTGASNKLKGNYTDYFTITEEYDNLAINYLRNTCADTLYISLSSGAVYGRGLSAPAGESTLNCLRVNHISVEDYYAIARINAEAKHRAFNKLNIVDLRVFSYFSRFIDLSESYFVAEALDCILKKKMFVTDNVNFVRDYIHPQDLYSIVRKCIYAGKINAAFDAVSRKPVTKKEILDYFSSAYGLKYKIGRLQSHASPTGQKNIYCSNYNSASSIGYKSAFSSMDAIKDESKYILSL